jgi:hypothetical protein
VIVVGPLEGLACVGLGWLSVWWPQWARGGDERCCIGMTCIAAVLWPLDYRLVGVAGEGVSVVPVS